MTYADQSLAGFLDAVADGGVTPGGGGGAAVAAATGTALFEMVCANTVGREDFADVADELEAERSALAERRDRLLGLADADAEAIEALMAAYGTPDGEGRTEAIQAATVEATEVPLALAETAADVLERGVAVAEAGNPNAVADGAIGAHLLHGALGAARFTVGLNVGSIEDGAVADELADRADAAERAGERAFERIEGLVEERG